MRRFGEQPIPEAQEPAKKGLLLPEERWREEIQASGFHDAEMFLADLYAQTGESIGTGYAPPDHIMREYLAQAMQNRKMSQEDRVLYLEQFRLSCMLGYPRTPEN